MTFLVIRNMNMSGINQYQIVNYAKGLWMFIDVKGWQKWFGAAVMGFAFALSFGNNFSLLQLQALVIGMPLLLSYTMTVNDCFDIEIDKIKEKVMGKKLIVSNVISRSTALTITLLSVIIGLVSAWFGSLNFFIVASLIVLLSTVYSVPPFRLKMKYPYSTLTQFAGIFLPFIAGVALIGTVTIEVVIISSVFAVLAMIHRFQHEIATREADFITGKQTVAVTKGLRTAKTLRKLCAFIGIAEFAVFFVLGWVDTIFLLLFILYVVLYTLIVTEAWVGRLPFLRKMSIPIILVSSYALLIFVLFLYGHL
jgi:4-hydroxybenzoate polyprenyltransferase